MGFSNKLPGESEASGLNSPLGEPWSKMRGNVYFVVFNKV